MNNSPRPPKFPIWLLRLIANRGIVDEIEGDLHEDYLNNIEVKGRSKARRIHLWTAFCSLRPYLLAHRRENRKPKYTDMVIYHLKMATRHMSKSRVFTAINIFGLTIGLASSLAILLFIIDQSRMDDFQAKQDRIYRLEAAFQRGDKISHSAKVHSHLLPAIGADMPGIEAYARVSKSDQTLVFTKGGNKSLVDESFLYADSTFLKIFDFQIISGQRDKLLQDPLSLIITESAALRHFGHTNVVGETIEFSDEYQESKKIVAVMADPPGNSSIQFDFLTSSAELIPPGKNPFKSRLSISLSVYLLLHEGVTPESIAAKIVPELSKHTDRKNLVESIYSLNSFDDLKYDMAISDNLITPVDKRVIRMFSIIALFIIALALINYINLTSAKSIQRVHEAGIRKVVGASRKTLIGQMLMESLMTCFIAMSLALIMLELIIPFFETILERKLFFDYTSSFYFITGLVIFTLILSAIAGFYPALILSRFKFAQIMKGRAEHNSRGSLLRKVLVIFQFSFSISLIIGVLLVQNQLDFIRTKTLSYNPEHIIVMKGSFGMMSKNYKTIRAELGQIPGVTQVSVTNITPGDGSFGRGSIRALPFSFTRGFADENYLNIFNLKLLEGSNFNPLADSASAQVIINQSMAKLLDIEEPLYSTKYQFVGRYHNKIIGIMEDSHFESLHDEIRPMVIAPASALAPALSQIVVKVENTDFSQTVNKIESVWDKFFPDSIFNYQFLDDKLDRLYTAEYRLSKIFGIFTILAILISCLGLFGLSMHIAEVKLKEVSIRKVLGASVVQVMRQLSGQIYLLIFIAALIAAPLAYYFMGEWLQDFAYKAKLSVNAFILTLLASVVLATITTCWHTIKTARTNPAETLRNE